MGSTDDRPLAHVASRADAVAARLGDEPSFADAARTVQAEFDELLRALRDADARFAFDRDGRPGAVHAVREALPLMERELFDAVMEDHACEVAAVQEALYQVLLACGRQSRP